MKSFNFLGVAGAIWAASILLQEMVLFRGHSNYLWFGSFVCLGEAFFHVFNVRDKIDDCPQWRSRGYVFVVVGGILQAFFIGALLNAVISISPLCSLLVWYAAAIGNSCSREGKFFPGKKFLFLVLILLIFVFFLNANGSFELHLFSIIFFGAMICIKHAFNSIFLTGRECWEMSGQYIMGSVFLALSGCFLGTQKHLKENSFFSWPVLPLFAFFSGFGESFYFETSGGLTKSTDVLGSFIIFLPSTVLKFLSDGVCMDDVFLLLSAVVILYCALNVENQSIRLRSTETSLFFGSTSAGNSVFIQDVIEYFSSNQREKKLFIFLLLTGSIMLLEFLYGVSVNSLGLIADSFHMMLDSASIAIGLCAAFAASWPSNEKTHPFGYARYEVLGGFVNGVLLLFIAIFVVVESIERLVNPPEIEAAYLIHVSFIGLLVNVVGIVFFHEAHGHSHAHGGCCAQVDHNLRGVYLHILADLLGSVSVMISSILISLTGLRLADPICSAISCIFIALSAFPLLEETGRVLILSNPVWESDTFSERITNGIKEVPGVISVGDIFTWTHSTAPRESIFCTVRVSVHPDENKPKTRKFVKHFLRSFLIAETGARRMTLYVHFE